MSLITSVIKLSINFDIIIVDLLIDLATDLINSFIDSDIIIIDLLIDLVNILANHLIGLLRLHLFNIMTMFTQHTYANYSYD